MSRHNNIKCNRDLQDWKNLPIFWLFVFLIILGNNRRGWNASSQRYSNVIQPSSFPKSTPWGGSRDQDKPPFGSFDSGASTSRGFGSSQNPFASPLSDEQKDEKKLLWVKSVVENQLLSFSRSNYSVFSKQNKKKKSPMALWLSQSVHTVSFSDLIT